MGRGRCVHRDTKAKPLMCPSRPVLAHLGRGAYLGRIHHGPAWHGCPAPEGEMRLRPAIEIIAITAVVGGGAARESKLDL